MPKTKKSSTVKKSNNIKKVVEKDEIKTNKNQACTSSCWLCWMFKIMIGMFIIMIIFWLGFAFGALTSYTQNRGSIYSSKMSIPRSGFCVSNMDTLMSKVSKDLGSKTGDNFDKEFLLQMSIHHEAGIEMAKQALEASGREEVKELAQNIIDSETKQVESIKAWLDKWFTK